MKVLLSIKPEFAQKIFEGKKKYEFRRSIFKNPRIQKIIVYASSPVQKIIGEFEIEAILTESPKDLWSKTKKYSGISEEYFFEYFTNKKEGFAIKIKKPKLYRCPKNLKDTYNLRPPQSFAYVA